jgi:hypothetical protein
MLCIANFASVLMFFLKHLSIIPLNFFTIFF